MKTVGLLGGMSWESTLPYYRLVNQAVRERLGGLHSARLLLYSFDFHDIEQLQSRGEWREAGQLLATAARGLQDAGADFLVLCTNTMHMVADAIEAEVDIPLLHIADTTARAVKQAGHQRVGLLGTRFTMEQPFYAMRLQEHHGIAVVVPSAEDRAELHRIIFDELCRGIVHEDSRRFYRASMERLAQQGATAIILGCTEISMLVGSDDASVPLFDTTRLHALGAAEFALVPQDQENIR